MSTALLSICLWLGASPVALPQEETQIPSPVAVTEMVAPPALQVLSATLEEYRLAMHLIDVRGKNEEGAQKLLALVDRPDVIAMPGQASWLMTQASRALTLAGNAAEAKELLPGIRNGSRGTSFEDAVLSQLRLFGPEQFGISQTFLRFLLASWDDESQKFGQLRSRYGRALIPYFQYVIEDAQSEFGIDQRRQALREIFSMLDEFSDQWLVETLLEVDALTQSELLEGLNPRISGRYRYGFIDLKAQRGAATLASTLATHVLEQNKDADLPILLNYISWERPMGIHGDSNEWESVAQRVIKLCQNIPPSQASMPILHHLQYLFSSDQERYEPILREVVKGTAGDWLKWGIGRQESGINLLREWSLHGTDLDRIRFTCINPSFNNQRLHESISISQREMELWRRSFVDFGEWPFIPFQKINPEKVKSEDIAALIQCRDSAHPLVRFQAASCLEYYGETEEAIKFLDELGPDPTWAKHLLRTWRKTINDNLVHAILDRCIGTAVEAEARELVRREASGDISIATWKAYSLSLDTSGAGDLVNRLRANFDSEGLVWVILNSGWHLQDLATPFGYLSQVNPSRAISLLSEISEADREFLHNYLGSNHWDEAFRDSQDPDFLERFQFDLQGCMENSWQRYRNTAGLLSVVKKHDFPLALEIAIDLSDRQGIVLELISGGIPSGLNYPELQREVVKAAVAQFDHEQFSRNIEGILDLCRIGREVDEPAFQLVLDRVMESEWMPLYWHVFSLLIGEESLRMELRSILVADLREGVRIGPICRRLIEVGAVEELREELLSLNPSTLDTNDLTALIDALGTIDSAEIHRFLLEQVNDSRRSIRVAASNALTQLQNTREVKARWAAWAEGQEQTTVLMALLKDLEDPEMEVRLGAVKALGLLGDPEALPVLVDLLREDEPIKQAAKEALDRMGTAKKD